jgi:DNA-binding Lrp family transcriptional regulator
MSMPIAYVMINTEIGTMEDVLNILKKIPNVKEAHMVYGVYDIIVKVEADTMGTLKEILSKEIRSIDKIMSTLTMIAME